MREGKEFSFGELEKLAAKEEPFRSLIDPDAPEFAPSGNVPRRIREISAKRTGQPVPETEGQIVRCINESLALKYRMAFEEIRECTGKEYPVIHMVGGGTAECAAVPADSKCMRASRICRSCGGHCLRKRGDSADARKALWEVWKKSAV